MPKPKILFVDDEKMLRDTLARLFAKTYECLVAPDGETALRLIDENADLALVVTDMQMPGMSGLDLLRTAKAKRPTLPFIMLTAYGTMELAVDAMRNHGAEDFFQKPVTDLQAFERRIREVLENAALRRDVAAIENNAPVPLVPADENGLEAFTGTSPAMEKVYQLIRKVAPTSATVLVEGPSGTGKELVARAIHDLSPRKNKPFVVLECAAFSKDLLESELFGYTAGTFTGALKDGKAGCIESANGGTLFLDEIGEIDQQTQVTLLRTLEGRSVRRIGSAKEIPVDFRLVAATNKDLAAMVREGSFRSDLYYRLKVIDIRTPALKDHPEDIAPLAMRFVKEYARQYASPVKGIDKDALKALETHAWPGNVRELRNVIERAVVLATGEKITVSDLPFDNDVVTVVDAESLPRQDEGSSVSSGCGEDSASTGQQLSLAEAEKQQILDALEKCGGNKSKAAELLGVSRRTIHRKLKEWDPNHG